MTRVRGIRKKAFDFRDPAFRTVFGEQFSGPEQFDMAYMNEREEEEFLLHYGPRKERKAIKKRRKAEKRARNEKNKLG
jgi:hypothetical protein